MIGTIRCRPARLRKLTKTLTPQLRCIQASAKVRQAVPREATTSELSHSDSLFKLSAHAQRTVRESGRKAAPQSFYPPGTLPTDADVFETDASRSLSWDGSDLKIHNESAAPTIVSQWWLRDHCPCPSCTNQITKQRQTNLLKGEPLARIGNVTFSGSDMHITWTDEHTSTIPQSFILNHRSPITRALRGGHAPLHLWGSSLAPPCVSYPFISAQTLGPTLLALRQYGLVFLPSTPVTAAASESLLSLLGPIRNTHWGAFTVVTSDLTNNDTAWTSEALDPHNDNTYFSDAAGLQMLHLLSHDGEGGANLFVDGFSIAAQLHAQDPAAYEILSTVGIFAHSSGDEGVNVQPADSMPVLRHDGAGRLIQVRWNNADRAGVDAPLDKIEAWYEAAAKWQALLDKEENRLWVQLQPGAPVVFDNWRVMHGRAAFTGKRTMCGGYVNRDDYVSAYRARCYGEEKVRASTVTG